MSIVRIGILGIAGILTAMLVKEMRPQFATLISIASCLLIFFYALNKLQVMTDTLSEIQKAVSIQESYLEILLKIIGITYVADFSANICRDAGYQAIGGQIEVFGKISIFVVSTPVIMALLETIQKFMS